jgi:hypothetical protein
MKVHKYEKSKQQNNSMEHIFIHPTHEDRQRTVQSSSVFSPDVLTLWSRATHIWAYRTANLQMLHIKYLFNKYQYWIF